MTAIRGQCHCGNLEFELETELKPDALTLRRCQCRFCRQHGAVTARDPNGTVRIIARKPRNIILYRFATKTTDFVLCGNCGAYAAAVLCHAGKRYATLNMRLTSLALDHSRPADYDNESKKDRIERRVKKFTPVTECNIDDLNESD